ncbi:hypothetical protein RJ639_012167 [Escallonia herrerae]|uniref:Uncharacterized protein n=1 Tax=Escallonia herrerae TaxID=1293975 RepID=A0AA88VPS0_9ASTE|nr:hypothetical protein RJ639_012167 [Escallonia herrerae]
MAIASGVSQKERKYGNFVANRRGRNAIDGNLRKVFGMQKRSDLSYGSPSLPSIFGMRWCSNTVVFKPKPGMKGEAEAGPSTVGPQNVFELLDGYESAFGLYYVDMDDKGLKRYPKLSAYWYSNSLKGGRVGLDTIIVAEKKTLASSQSCHRS